MRALVLAREIRQRDARVERDGDGVVLAFLPRLAEVGGQALAALLALDRLAATRRRVDRAFTSFSAAVALALLVGIAIDLGVGPRVPPAAPPSTRAASDP